MIKYSIGNLLDRVSDDTIVAHQTNCAGIMGAGVALQIRKLLSDEQYKLYTDVCDREAYGLLGSVQYLNTNDGGIVANMFAEAFPGCGKLNKLPDTDYDALTKCFEAVKMTCKLQNKKLAIPGNIGCGLAGGDWDYVLNRIIKPLFVNDLVELEIVYFKEEDYMKYHSPYIRRIESLLKSCVEHIVEFEDDDAVSVLRNWFEDHEIVSLGYKDLFE